MSPDKVILYDYFASNCAWRVRTVLQWKNIPYETVTVDLVKGEQKTPEFLKINPYGAVPVLYIDGQYITQSIAICEYLEETRPENPIYPNNLTQRARVREIVEIINSYLVPLQNPTTAKKVEQDSACSDPNEQRAWSLEFFYKGFVALERLVAKSSGRYTVGDTVTFADMCLVPQVWRAKRLKPDFTEFPTICRLYEELLELNAFRLAHAANHPHCPADIKADACLAIKSD